MKKAYLFLLLAGVMFACTAPVQPEQKPDNQDEQNPGGDTNVTYVNGNKMVSYSVPAHSFIKISL